jgi:hypothetical protein
MLLLRQLAATGLTMLLLPLWAPRSPAGSSGGPAPQQEQQQAADDADPEQLPDAQQAAQQALQALERRLRSLDPAAVDAAAAALRAVVAADPPAFAAALFQQLAHGHPLLGGEAGQQRSGRWGKAPFSLGRRGTHPALGQQLAARRANSPRWLPRCVLALCQSPASSCWDVVCTAGRCWECRGTT